MAVSRLIMKGREIVKTQAMQRVAFVIDKSGSMRSISSKLPGLFLTQLEAIKKNNALYNMQTEVTLIEFDKEVRVVCHNLDINGSIPAIDSRTYDTTSLCSAVKRAVDLMKSNYPEMTYLVITMTDGIENSSDSWDKRWMIEDKSLLTLQGTDKWSFAFLVPDAKGVKYVSRLGVPRGNIKIWDATEQGVEKVRVETQSDIGNYYHTRSTGVTSTKSFFQPVTSNVEVVGDTCIGKMDEVTYRFKEYEVERGIDPATGKEWKVSDFTRAKTGRPYIAGESYYMLIKKEEVRSTKQVILRDKTTKMLYTGPVAREAIGLPKFKDAKVTPGNHANFDIFIQSTSDNRILPRGTKVLVRK